MSDETILTKDQTQLSLPPKPQPAFVTALGYGTIAAAATALMGVIAVKVPFWRSGKFGTAKVESVVDEAISSGTFGGIIGTAFGYAQGVKEQAEYPLKMENVWLKRAIKKHN